LERDEKVGMIGEGMGMSWRQEREGDVILRRGEEEKKGWKRYGWKGNGWKYAMGRIELDGRG